MTNKLKEKKGEGITAVWRNGGFSDSYDNLVVNSSAVLRLNFCDKNPPLRHAPKRYRHILNNILSLLLKRSIRRLSVDTRKTTSIYAMMNVIG